MMPVAFVRQPTDAKLAACLKEHRSASAEEAWKAFRAGECGKRAMRHLRDAYGTRCLYCDHADGEDFERPDSSSFSVLRRIDAVASFWRLRQTRMQPMLLGLTWTEYATLRSDGNVPTRMLGVDGWS